VLRECDAPEQASRNWLDRDVAVARWMLEQARGLGLICIEVDGRRAVTEKARIVAGHFGLVKSWMPKHQHGEGGPAFRDLSG
jgi:hypothetical protein